MRLRTPILGSLVLAATLGLFGCGGGGSGKPVKVSGKDVVCKVRAGTQKTEGGSVDAKLCISDKVPGGIVLHTRTSKEGNTTVAETTTALKSFAESDK